jgi:hypothetical protein
VVDGLCELVLAGSTTAAPHRGNVWTFPERREWRIGDLFEVSLPLAWNGIAVIIDQFHRDMLRSQACGATVWIYLNSTLEELSH